MSEPKYTLQDCLKVAEVLGLDAETERIQKIEVTPVEIKIQKVDLEKRLVIIETYLIGGAQLSTVEIPGNRTQVLDDAFMEVNEDRHNPLAEHCKNRGSGWMVGQRCLACEERNENAG